MRPPLGRWQRTRAPLVSAVVSLVLIGQGLLASTVGASTRGDDPSGISASSFTDSFGEMAHFRGLTRSGHGEVGVLLPDPGVERSVGPDLREALLDAGLRPDDVEAQDADGSDAAQFSAAAHDISDGARTLILDPIDSGVGTQIETYAQTKHVKTIDYGGLSLGGSRSYFVGYDNVAAGRELVAGLASCLTAWHVQKPRVLVLSNPPNDDAASAMRAGLEEALRPFLKSYRWADAAQPAGTWDPALAATELEAAHGGHRGANAALVSNDETDGTIIKYLQGAHVRPRTVPTTGYGATVKGLQNVLSGYQCGTVYLPAVREAQAAAALALYIRAGVRPPARLVNGTTADTFARIDVPSVLVSPQWVTSSNMATSVLEHGGVKASQLCAGSYAGACRNAGIEH